MNTNVHFVHIAFENNRVRWYNMVKHYLVLNTVGARIALSSFGDT
jgi:hypothetical protein